MIQWTNELRQQQQYPSQNECYLKKFRDLSLQFNLSSHVLMTTFVCMLKLFRSAIGFVSNKPEVDLKKKNKNIELYRFKIVNVLNYRLSKKI